MILFSLIAFALSYLLACLVNKKYPDKFIGDHTKIRNIELDCILAGFGITTFFHILFMTIFKENT